MGWKLIIQKFSQGIEISAKAGPRLAFVCLPLLFNCATVSADLDIDHLSGEAYTDIGNIVSATRGTQEVDGYYLNRFGVSLTAEELIKEKLELKVGVGGLFWQTYPRDPAAFHTNNIRFGPGINVASAEFNFRNDLSLKGGYFDYKYSPSMNLGEYLLRSEAYPTVLRTGNDWTWVDSAYNRSLGLRLKWNLLGGKVRQDLGLFLEYQTPPLFDMTPTYVVTAEPKKGIEIGGGVAFHRWLSANTQESQLDKTPIVRDSSIQNITDKSINLMGRFTVDFSELLNWPLAWGPFKIFSEVALLGVENQPVYYQNRMNRMPILLGTQAPTFGLLDLASLEVEYCQNPYSNSGKTAQTYYVPIPDNYSVTAKNLTILPEDHRDDWKWSVHLIRSITPGLKLKVQIANDHMRLLDWQMKYETYRDIFHRPGNWYYLAHLQWGF